MALTLSIPLFPAAGAPSSSFRSSSGAPFLTTVHAVKAAKTLEADIAPALAHQPPALEAIETRRLWAGIPVPPLPNTRGGDAEAAPPTRLIVEEGQNPWQIATRYGISVDALLFANGLRPNQILQVGQQLVIPSFSKVPDRTTRSTPTPSPTPPSSASWHMVGEGESLWTIAQNYGVSLESLATANDLTEESIIHPGEKLAIPARSLPGQTAQTSVIKKSAAAPKKPSSPVASKSIVVRSGQTLFSIARANRVSISAIVAANNLPSADRIRVGQWLTIPGDAVTPRRRGTIATPESAPLTPRVANVLLWPARGMITSGFGWRRTHYHGGVDISANWGSPIAAAIAGRVTHVGWYGGYGLAVVLDHGDGLQTIYGHASKILVQVGDEVDSGEVIALVGCTGVCTGPHIHFEVRIDGHPVNPLEYLP